MSILQRARSPGQKKHHLCRWPAPAQRDNKSHYTGHNTAVRNAAVDMLVRGPFGSIHIGEL